MPAATFPETPADGADGSRVRWRASLLACCALLTGPTAGRAVDAKAPSPDAELLEFLGSGDDADADLKDYLAQPAEPPARDADSGAKPRSSRT